MRCASLIVVVFVAFFVSASAIAQADTIGPQITVSTVSVNQTANGGPTFGIENLTNDSGMGGELQSPASGDNSYTGMWRQQIADGNTIAASQITFDLGAAKNVGAMAVWNYDEWADQNARGIQQFTLWSSNDGTNYTQVGATGTLTESVAGNWAKSAHDTFNFIGLNAHYIRMDLVSNLGDANWYGLGEVRFYSVPEPSALILLTFGVIGLLAYAWRKRK